MTDRIEAALTNLAGVTADTHHAHIQLIANAMGRRAALMVVLARKGVLTEADVNEAEEISLEVEEQVKVGEAVRLLKALAASAPQGDN